MMIETTDELQEVCRRFATYPYVTVDTEFIREKTYYPDLCLIQLASRDEAYCIDPLAPNINLSALFELFQNKNVVKVFHAGRQDIEIFLHLSGEIPSPVFDTQIGAMVCGFGENVAYGQLVQTLLGVRLDKSMRCTNWARRPLSEEQIQYGLCDVTYLRDVYEKITARLEETKRLSWIQEELAVLTNPETYNPTPEQIYRKIHYPFSKPLAILIYQKLYLWRENLAKSKNRPRRYLVKDELLAELALVHPQNTEQLKEMRGIPSNFENSSYANAIIKIINEALKCKSSDLPHVESERALSVAEKNLLSILKFALTIVADREEIAPSLIASSDDLANYVREKQAPFLTGWRYNVFGQIAEQLAQGNLGIYFDAKKGEAVMGEIHNLTK